MDFFPGIRPFLDLLDPEVAHRASLWALTHALIPAHSIPDDPMLQTEVWGRSFLNPIGLAAGFDKDAVAIRPALGLGFGFVEVGSVTPKAQAGNPRPRVFRLPEDGAIINRLGFPSAGMAAVADRLGHWRGTDTAGVVGVNLGKNRDTTDAAEDFAAGARTFAPCADYLVINVSSPNTPGLRTLQGPQHLEHLVDRVGSATGMDSPPILIKLAPDLLAADLQEIGEVALSRRLRGLIIGNTTTERPARLRGRHSNQGGGLSGRPLFERSTKVLSDLYRMTAGKVPMIGVGGVSSGADAYAKIRAGASLVQLYTALVYYGPRLVPRIKAELAALLRRDGFASVAEAVGADHRSS